MKTPSSSTARRRSLPSSVCNHSKAVHDLCLEKIRRGRSKFGSVQVRIWSKIARFRRLKDSVGERPTRIRNPRLNLKNRLSDWGLPTESFNLRLKKGKDSEGKKDAAGARRPVLLS